MSLPRTKSWSRQSRFVSGNSFLIKSWESETFSEVSRERKSSSHYNFPVMKHNFVDEEAGLLKPVA